MISASFPGNNQFRINEAGLAIVKNSTGETIPPRSFVKVAPYEKLENNRHVVTGEKPDGDGDLFVITGECSIAAGRTGVAYWATAPVWVAFSGDPPDLEEGIVEVGPSEGSWEMDAEGSGFHCLFVDEDKSLALVREIGGGKAALILFEIEEADTESDCLRVWATAVASSCGAGLPEGTFPVYDLLGCLFNVPPDFLPEIRGWAARMKYTPPEGVEGEGENEEDPDDPCRWVAISLCCTDEECLCEDPTDLPGGGG